MQQEGSNISRRSAADEARLEQIGYALQKSSDEQSTLDFIRTLFGLKLNFLIPSSSVVFLCLAFSKRPGSSLYVSSLTPLVCMLSVLASKLRSLSSSLGLSNGGTGDSDPSSETEE